MAEWPCLEYGQCPLGTRGLYWGLVLDMGTRDCIGYGHQSTRGRHRCAAKLILCLLCRSSSVNWKSWPTHCLLPHRLCQYHLLYTCTARNADNHRPECTFQLCALRRMPRNWKVAEDRFHPSFPFGTSRWGWLSSAGPRQARQSQSW